MSEVASTKPYMIRAIYEWCVDNGFTPHVLVAVDATTRVPHGYVKNGEIVLNINYSATKDLLIANDAITFSARFNGVSSDLYVPVERVRAVFARENGQGVFFEPVDTHQAQDGATATQGAGSNTDDDNPTPPSNKKPSLRLVK